MPTSNFVCLQRKKAIGCLSERIDHFFKVDQVLLFTCLHTYFLLLQALSLNVCEARSLFHTEREGEGEKWREGGREERERGRGSKVQHAQAHIMTKSS